MRNIDILNLAKADIFSVSANTLEAAHAYKVVKFKGAIRKALISIEEANAEIAKEANIEDVKEFDRELNSLRQTGRDPGRLATLEEKLSQLDKLRAAMYRDDAKLEGVKTIPYDQFFALQKENKELPHRPLEAFADILEGVLWEVPETA